jgi:hypothetical protein
LVRAVDLDSLAMDETHVYWTSSEDTAVFRFPLSGTGTPEAIALNQERPSQVVSNGAHVYWIENGGFPNSAIKRVAKQGGEAPLTLAAAQNQALALNVDSEFVYWATSISLGNILRSPLSGSSGEPTVLVANQNLPGAVAVDGKSLFWMNVVTPVGMDQPWTRAGVTRCPLAGCDGAGMETLAIQAHDAPYSWSMAVDETHLYWVALAMPEPGNAAFRTHSVIYRYVK